MPTPKQMTVMETLQTLQEIHDKAHQGKELMCAVETAASAAIIQVINDYLNATYVNLGLEQVEKDANYIEHWLHDINASVAKLKGGLPPVMA